MAASDSSEVALERGTRSGSMGEQAPPDSWEMADLVENMQAVALPHSREEENEPEGPSTAIEAAGSARSDSDGRASGTTTAASRNVEQVDSFLLEALQNPCDRLTILRLEQEVERFIRNPKLQQLEFQPMPSSYLRLAAHRVAQHYFLQSIVVDSGSSEGTRIIARKTADSRHPAVRLADIPVDVPQEEKLVTLPMPKVAIKQRPQKGSHSNGDLGGGGGHGGRLNPSKSVEERKEEYNKARARIFCGENVGRNYEDEVLVLESLQVREPSLVVDLGRVEEKNYVEDARENAARSVLDTSAVAAESNGSGRGEKDNVSRAKLNSSNRVAIFRDREKDRRDPDYDRNFDRYSHRFDPGFGINVAPYGVQAMYAPLSNYNTEFPQLGGIQRPQMVMEPPLPPPLPHMRGPWGGPVGSLGFRPGEAHMGPYNPGHIAPHSSMMYMHGPQYGYPGPNMGYVHPSHDHFQQTLTQPHPQQPDAGFNQARCR